MLLISSWKMPKKMCKLPSETTVTDCQRSMKNISGRLQKRQREPELKLYLEVQGSLSRRELTGSRDPNGQGAPENASLDLPHGTLWCFPQC